VQYYRFDSRNVTFAEYRRLTPGLGFLIAALLKILRIPLPVRMALPYPGEILVREPAELPEGVYKRLVPFNSPCEREGLSSKFFYKEPMIAPDSRTLGVALLSDDALTYGFLAEAEHNTAAGIQRRIDLSLITPLSNGRMLVTGRSKQTLDSPPEMEKQVLPGTPVEKVIARHRDRLRELKGIVQPVPIEGRLEDFILKVERLGFDFFIRRRVYIPMAETEVEKLRALKPMTKGKAALVSILIWLATFATTFLAWRGCSLF
jgi:hypothetical protein